MSQCILKKCQSPELCNFFSSCDAKDYKEDFLKWKAENERRKKGND